MGSSPSSQKNSEKDKIVDESQSNNGNENLFKREKLEFEEKLKEVEEFTITKWQSEYEIQNEIFRKFTSSWFSNQELKKEIYSEIRLTSKVSKLFILFHENFLLNDENFFYAPLFDTTKFLQAGTHNSFKFGKSIFEDGCIELISKKLINHWRLSIDTLLDEKFTPEIKMNVEQRFTLLLTYLSIIYNTLRLNSDLRSSIRDLGLLNQIKNFIKQTSKLQNEKQGPYLKVKFYIILAYMIKEDEQDIVTTNEETLSVICSILKNALDTDDHYLPDYGYHVDETLLAINQLAISDHNKKIIQQYIPLLFRSITEAKNGVEQKCAAECLWALTFDEDCLNFIQSDENIKIIEELSKNGMSKGGKRMADNVLFELRKSEKIKQLDDSLVNAQNGHIMLSYNWSYKSTVLKIRDFLREKGYNIWIDVDSMGGSTIDSMVEGVEKAYVVILCFSEEYYKSTACRSEAEYTYNCKKSFIPIRMQKNYKPIEWLSFIIGSTFWVDFSEPSQQNSAFSKLLQQVESKHEKYFEKKIQSQPEAKIPTVVTVENSSIVQSWTCTDVQNFVRNECGLKKYASSFKNCNGTELLELKKLYDIDTTFFYNSMKNDLGISLLDCLKIATKLQTLK